MHKAVGLFHKVVGYFYFFTLFLVGLFYKAVGLFCMVVGLFYKVVGLSCQVAGLFFKVVAFFYYSSWIYSAAAKLLVRLQKYLRSYTSNI